MERILEPSEVWVVDFNIWRRGSITRSIQDMITIFLHLIKQVQEYIQREKFVMPTLIGDYTNVYVNLVRLNSKGLYYSLTIIHHWISTEPPPTRARNNQVVPYSTERPSCSVEFFLRRETTIIYGTTQLFRIRNN